MATMPRNEYDVWLEDPETKKEQHTRVRVFQKDMIVVERELQRRGKAVKDSPVEAGTLFAWAAMRRLGHGVGDIDAFLDRVLLVNALKETAGDVDPTQPAAVTDSA